MNCEKKCLYDTNFTDRMCKECNKYLKEQIGGALTFLLRKRFDEEHKSKANTLYVGGVKHGLLEAAAIVQGQGNFWFEGGENE